ncbi:MAG: biotin/lipoyl-binding protein [Kiritimatiellae bacterium]|nr:biotin/lipoyl-binding protein [Kiritimatiellia bacterium]
MKDNSIEFKIPELGENITEGDVVKVLVSVGEPIHVDQALLELETGKAAVEIPSEINGTIKEVLIKDGDKVKVGQIVIKLETHQKEEPAVPPTDTQEKDSPPKNRTSDTPKIKEALPTPPSPNPSATDTTSRSHVPVRAAPSVRKFAREIGVNISEVTSSDGRITVNNVKAYAKQRLTQEPLASTNTGIPSPSIPDFSKWGKVGKESISTIRKITARHMAMCWSTIPHVTQHDKADITDLEKIRKHFKQKAEDAGGKLTPTAILTKIVAAALKAFPTFNASIDVQKNEVIYKKYCHIGVAVDIPKGLLVPVIRDVDKKNIIELSVELSRLAEETRKNTISPDKLQGGCFTISNIGGIGGTHFTPIVNFPEVAILGVGQATHEPVYIDGNFEPRLIMPLSLSYDHRLIDGANGARFLRWIVKAINEPLLLALEG